MKKLVLGMLIASSSLNVLAAGSEPTTNWIGGLSYISLSDDDGDLDLRVGGVVGSLGYRIKSGDNFYIIPEVRIGTGIDDDSVTINGVTVKLELDQFVALSVRGQFEFNNGFYLFAAPSYANAEFTASASSGGSSASASDDSWEFGVGGGVGFYFNDTGSAEVILEQFDGTDVFNIGFKFYF